MDSTKARKRTRKSAKHSKTGCLTCRIRRVKCDGERPICSRCRSFEVDCDGYQPRSIPAYSKPLVEGPVLLPRLPVGQQLQSSLCLTPFEVDDEARYFDMFFKSTVDEILPYCQATMYSPMLWGACAEPSIRHSIVALAALHETSRTVQHASALSFDLWSGGANEHHQKAIHYYSKAIRVMREALVDGKQNLRTTLITCLLTFAFEAYHGNIPLAVAQIQTGIALIEDWKKANSGRVNEMDPASLDDDIIECFNSLEIQLIPFHDNRSYDNHARLRQQFGDEILHMPSCFVSMKQAQKYLQKIMKHLEHFQHISRGLKGFYYREEETDTNVTSREVNITSEALSYQTYYRAELGLWNSAFQALLERSNPQFNPIDSAMRLYVQLHYAVSNLVVETLLATDEMIYDNFTDHFAQMITLSGSFPRRMDTSGKPQWNFDSSVILPLYLVGLKCRASDIRQTAIHLLLSTPRREGLWDGVLLGKTADWVRGIEEEYMDGGHVPEWARVSNVRSSFDLQQRRAKLVCKQCTAEGVSQRFRRMSFSW